MDGPVKQSFGVMLLGLPSIFWVPSLQCILLLWAALFIITGVFQERGKLSAEPPDGRYFQGSGYGILI